MGSEPKSDGEKVLEADSEEQQLQPINFFLVEELREGEREIYIYIIEYINILIYYRYRCILTIPSAEESCDKIYRFPHN